MTLTEERVPEHLRALIDDAAIFPPTSASVEDALREHREHLASPHHGVVGGFVVSDTRLPDLTRLVAEDPGADPLRLSLVVTGGAGAIEGAVRWATRAEGISLAAVEFALRDEEDLAHNAQRVLAATDALAEELNGVALHVEPPRVHGQPTSGWLAALDELATREVRLKFRTGGVTPEAFPSPDELAACIGAALDRELPFKCTAGLHHAIRGEAGLPSGEPVTQHGFLNVLVATRTNLDGGDTAAALAETDPAAVVGDLEPAVMARTRRWFTSFGSCSVRDPLEDLVGLGLLLPSA